MPTEALLENLVRSMSHSPRSPKWTLWIRLEETSGHYGVKGELITFLSTRFITLYVHCENWNRETEGTELVRVPALGSDIESLACHSYAYSGIGMSCPNLRHLHLTGEYRTEAGNPLHRSYKNQLSEYQAHRIVW